MDISSILKVAGTTALKSLPYGGLVLDVVEAATGKDVPDRENASGETLEKIISELPEDQKAMVLTKKLDTEARVLETRNALKEKMEEDTPASQARAKVALAFAGIVALLSIGFAIMMVHAYIYNGIYPSVELTLIVFGLPMLGLLAYFGIDTKTLQQLIITVLQRQLIKGKVK